MVHELRKLRRAEEFTYRRHNWLRIDQVVRHDCVYIDRAHTLFDRTLHTHQTDAVIVFHQLTDRTNAAVAEVVDIVDFAFAVFQIEDDLRDANNVIIAEGTLSVFRWLIARDGHFQTGVHFHPANRRQVITLAIKEELIEQSVCRFLGWWLTRAHNTVNV